MVQVQDAVKKETVRIGTGTAAASAVMVFMFFVFHLVIPDSVPFDYKVIVGAVMGSVVAVGNFFFMGLTVQKIADTQDQDLAYRRMKTSYRYRMMIQFIWVILSVTLPFINGVAGIFPLFVPGAVIKTRGILGTIKSNK